MATIWKTWLEHDDNADNEGVVGDPGGEQLLQRPAASFLTKGGVPGPDAPKMQALPKLG